MEGTDVPAVQDELRVKKEVYTVRGSPGRRNLGMEREVG